MTATDSQPLPRSVQGGFLYCMRCPTLLWVPRDGVRLCGDCHAAAETPPAGEQPDDQQQGEQR